MSEDVQMAWKNPHQVAKIYHISNMDIFCHFMFCQNRRNDFCFFSTFHVDKNSMKSEEDSTSSNTQVDGLCICLHSDSKQKNIRELATVIINTKITPSRCTGSSHLMQISLLQFFKTITKILLIRFYGLFILLLRT